MADHHQFRQQRHRAGLAAYRRQRHHPPGGCSVHQRHPQQPGSGAKHHLVRPANRKKSPVASWHQRSGHQMELWMDGQGGQRYVLQSSTNLTGLVGGQHQFVFEQLLPVPLHDQSGGMFYRGHLSRRNGNISANSLAGSFDEPPGLLYRLAMRSIQATATAKSTACPAWCGHD